jgi:hypothetical protein
LIGARLEKSRTPVVTVFAAATYTIRAIPYPDPQQEAERLKAVHEARVKIVPRV